MAVGRTDAPSLPVTLGPALSGPFDLWVARFSLLPQGADRVGASSWLSGMAPSFLGVNRMPVSGDGSFALLTSGAPGASSSSCGVPVAGMFVALNSNPVGFQLANMIQVHLNLPILVALPAPTTPGYVPLPLTGIPKGQPAAFQCAYAYPGCPLLQASNALQIVVQ